jgi:hypothetical protein
VEVEQHRPIRRLVDVRRDAGGHAAAGQLVGGLLDAIAVDEGARDQTAEHQRAAARIDVDQRGSRRTADLPGADVGVDGEELVQVGGQRPAEAGAQGVEVDHAVGAVRHLDHEIRRTTRDAGQKFNVDHAGDRSREHRVILIEAAARVERAKLR